MSQMSILFEVEDLSQIEANVFDKDWRVIKVRTRGGMKKSLILNQTGKKFLNIEEAQDFKEKQKEETTLKRRLIEEEDTSQALSDETYNNPLKAKIRRKAYSKEKEDWRIETLERNHIRNAASWEQRFKSQQKYTNKRNKIKSKKTKKLTITSIVNKEFEKDELILEVEDELLKEFDFQEGNAPKRYRR